MIAKDILRIALFLLVAILALRFGPRTRGSVRINNNAETDDTEAQQMFQRMQDTRENITREPKQYENKTAGKGN